MLQKQMFLKSALDQTVLATRKIPDDLSVNKKTSKLQLVAFSIKNQPNKALSTT